MEKNYILWKYIMEIYYGKEYYYFITTLWKDQDATFEQLGHSENFC